MRAPSTNPAGPSNARGVVAARLLIMSSSTFRLYEVSARLRPRWRFCQAEIPDVLTYRPLLASWVLRPSPLIFLALSARAGRAFSFSALAAAGHPSATSRQAPSFDRIRDSSGNPLRPGLRDGGCLALRACARVVFPVNPALPQNLLLWAGGRSARSLRPPAQPPRPGL